MQCAHFPNRNLWMPNDQPGASRTQTQGAKNFRLAKAAIYKERNSTDGGGTLEIMSDRVNDTAHDFRLVLISRRAHHKEELLQLVYGEWKEEVEESREDEDCGPL
ncbi:hypothetical protein BOTCAL_0222g00110 [Botryotinia calthae]|uniref:Uncharacterized protein n=1 Tax=Botryotinia calthae TaxID=38488 RepID=A0A4Y8CYR7_9HELO|nr:hypothetical protein BOTCAL_0222g00110 [Botryotinia calthae]